MATKQEYVPVDLTEEITFRLTQVLADLTSAWGTLHNSIIKDPELKKDFETAIGIVTEEIEGIIVKKETNVSFSYVNFIKELEVVSQILKDNQDNRVKITDFQKIMLKMEIMVCNSRTSGS